MGTFACIQYRYIALKNGTSVVLSQLAFNISYKTHFNEGLMKAAYINGFDGIICTQEVEESIENQSNKYKSE